MKIEQEDQFILLRIKSLLNYLSYIIKDEHKKYVDDYYSLCRKYCSWEEQDEKS